MAHSNQNFTGRKAKNAFKTKQKSTKKQRALKRGSHKNKYLLAPRSIIETETKELTPL